MAKKVNRSITANSLNFRPATDVKFDKKGTKPLPDPTSIKNIILLMIIHLCRKVLFIDPNIKVGVYILLVFFGSILGDVLPIPNTYFSRKDNLFNVYFVKLSWGWTMTFVGSFVYLTSNIYCCGDKTLIRKHLLRLLVATINWFFWTNLFVYIEEGYGYCSKAIVRGGRKSCLTKGFTWHGFSISGHTFILIYCTLIIMEEAKALINWEAIKDHLRNEEHLRSNMDNTSESSPMAGLSQEQLSHVKDCYCKFTPYIRAAFLGMTCLALIWDVMLLATIIYFHSTPEKFIASVISVLLWFFTYRFLFHRRILALLPGDGVFRYMNPVSPFQSLHIRRASLVGKTTEKVPKFMGMPLNPLRATIEEGSLTRASALDPITPPR